MPDTTLLIILVSFAGALIILVTLRLFFAAVRNSLLRDLSQRMDTSRALRAAGFANCFGVLSKGMGQIRGNGALVLLPEKLYFLMAAPRCEVDIPLERITGLSTTRKFLGKLSLRPLLRVDFTADHGPDAVAFDVARARDWITDIETATRKHSA